MHLLRELKEALSRENLLLTAAVGAGKLRIDIAYDIPEVAKYLDLINVMTYDLHGGWENVTHHHSTLFGHRDDTGNNTYLNVVS